MKQRIADAMSKAFFGSAWAEQAEDTGNSSAISGKEIFNIMPGEIDPAAVHASSTLLMDMERTNGKDIVQIYESLQDRVTPEEFGHYSAMQAMGHGTGLFDYDITDEDVKVPYFEFGSHSLERDYFEQSQKAKFRPS